MSLVGMKVFTIIHAKHRDCLPVVKNEGSLKNILIVLGILQAWFGGSRGNKEEK